MTKITTQIGKVIWFTGLSGAGKTTLANGLYKRLRKLQVSSVILDGDILRKNVNTDLGFSLQDRRENIRRTAEIAKMLAEQNIYVLVGLITPKEEFREMAKTIVEEGVEFQMVYVKTSLSTCQNRDVKGLYALAGSGKLKSFTGISSIFEEPKDVDLIIPTEKYSIDLCIEKLLNSVVRYC
ncbi:MAG: adenylyl-sulfate kinase [Pseudopedobacter saltans]|uniref:Adenylyl-sulfate kinase n=1 Tax=Pseudopedobacter saltans TaxID=151895 RepID=A0A2W5EUE3_9SPHI|nr:MAG: adenylyl-sulfate kinase [Pseudopedobacter saltans]